MIKRCVCNSEAIFCYFFKTCSITVLPSHCDFNAIKIKHKNPVFFSEAKITVCLFLQFGNLYFSCMHLCMIKHVCML